MLLVQVPVKTPPCSVDDFPEGCERSVKGALRVRPGTLTLTQGEYDHMKAKHKGLKLVVVQYKHGEAYDTAKSIKGKEAAKAAAEAPATPKRPKDNVSARKRKAAEKAEAAKKAEAPAPKKAALVTPPPPVAEPEPEPDKDKPKGKSKGKQ